MVPFRKELELHSRILIDKPEVIVLNKIDLDSDGLLIEDLKQRLPKNKTVLAISAVTGKGVSELNEILWNLVKGYGNEPDRD